MPITVLISGVTSNELSLPSSDSTVTIAFADRIEDFGPRLNEADVLAARGSELTPAVVSACPSARWIHSWTAGADAALAANLPLTEHPAVLTAAKGNGAIPLAEHAFMLMLMLAGGASRWLAAQQERKWRPHTHRELNGLVCGLIGLGNTGRDLAEKARAFHMHTLGLRRSIGAPVPGVDETLAPDRLPELLQRSDFVVITAPLTHQTRGMISERELRWMKPSSYLVCVSRGGIIDDDALLRALNERWISGVGLDAHGEEPLPPGSPFWDAPNALITPHSGAQTSLAHERRMNDFRDNFVRFRSGLPLANVVDRLAGY